MDTIIVHWSELGLKGLNQPDFVVQLKANIKQTTSGLGLRNIRRQAGGLLLELAQNAALDQIKERLSQIPGIANFLPVKQCLPDLEALKAELESMLASRRFKTFAVKTRRTDKDFPLTSPEINTRLGEWISHKTNSRVDLSKPELTIFVAVAPQASFVGFEQIAGPGGLPVGSSGRGLSLISGGLDSPVAAWLMLKRGLELSFVHFHSYPYLAKTSQDKVIQLVKRLSVSAGAAPLYLVPFGDLQKQLLLNAPARYLVILYRRFMFRIAEKLAQKEKARALVTGESLGQVASQTLENMTLIARSVELPVLRPLVGLNKEEIIAQARVLGTYDTSIIPDQDCCQLFVPKHPTTHARQETIESIEAALPLAQLMQQALNAVEKI